MTSQELRDFTFNVIFEIAKDFFILLMLVWVCEWFAVKRGYRLFVRAWIITVVVLLFLVSVGWYTFGRNLIWL